jgi:hypothetical protein
MYFKVLTTNWRLLICWHYIVSSACSVYHFLSNRHAGIKRTARCIYDFFWVHEILSTVEKIRFYLVATLLDMNGRYLLFNREFVASVRTEGRKHRYPIFSACDNSAWRQKAQRSLLFQIPVNRSPYVLFHCAAVNIVFWCNILKCW